MRNFKIAICISLVAFLLCGCVETPKLRDLCIIEGMSIDEKDSGVEMTIQSLNFSAEGGSAKSLSGNITINTAGDGETISSGIADISKKLTKKLFFGQNKLIVFGRELAETSIEDNIDYFVRSPDSRPDVILCVSDTKGSDILESEENDAVVPCENIVTLLKTGEEMGFTSYVTVADALKLYVDKTSDIFLPVLSYEGDSVEIAGIGLFDGERLSGTLDEEETKGFLLIKNKIKDSYIMIKDEEHGNIGLKIISPKTKLYVTRSGETLTFHVKIKTSLEIDEIENGLMSDIATESIRIFEQLAQQEIIQLSEKAFGACQRYSSDSMRIGEYLCKADKGYYSSVQDNWKEHFKNVQIKVETTCKVTKVNDNSTVGNR